MAAGQIRRRIVFYGWEDIEGMPSFERLPAVAAIRGLRGRAWSFVEDDFTTAAIVDRPGTSSAPTCLRFFRLRSGDELPHVVNARREATPLQLQRDESVTDWTHVVLWPDNYAAHDSRRDAPSMSRLRTYFSERANQSVRFYPLYDRSLIDQLEQLDDIKAVEIKMQLSRAEELERAQRGGLFGGLIDVGEQADAAVITTKVSVGTSRTRFLNPRVRQEVGNLVDRAEELLDNLVITGVHDGTIVEIDVLRRRLERILSVRRSRNLGNAPDPDVMYDVIIQTRRDFERDNRLQRAVRIR
jgi:hypothetical protein